MSSSTHQIKIKGVDQTSAAFGSVKGRAVATGQQIQKMVGGALAAAGAYLSLGAVKGGIDELGHLSDIAMKTSTNVGELTQMTAAFGALGIQNMSVENLAKSFDYMAKTTGRSGMEGFYETLEELGKIEDTAKRGQEAMRIFGRSGMEFMPLINAAGQSADALRTVASAMPSIPQAAADAGDACADAMGFAAGQMKSIWLQGLGAVCGWFDNEYAGGVQEASLRAGNYMEYYAKVGAAKAITAFRKVQEYLKRFGDSIGSFIGAKMGGGSWSDAWDAAKGAYSAAVEEYETVAIELEKRETARTERFKREFEKRAIAIEKYNGAATAAAVGVKDREKMGGGINIAEEAKKSPTVKNELILGGHDANRLSLLGPQFQSETKKQTTLLQKIAENTQKTSENTEAVSESNLEVI
ncbi:MAG: hypothetical protein IKC80_10060 [Kiritimatiellae bacterium]|nr:hypothetical protein [Kiritimatiellia bacterium]